MSPRANCSDAVSTNQPPAQLIMLFAMSEIAPKGSSRRVNRRQGLSRYTVDASLNSRGIVSSDWWKLNAMFHAWLVKISRIAASSSPTVRPGTRAARPSTTAGMNDRIGILCRMSSSGIITRSACRLATAIFAYARLKTSEITYASDIRSVEYAA